MHETSRLELYLSSPCGDYGGDNRKSFPLLSRRCANHSTPLNICARWWNIFVGREPFRHHPFVPFLSLFHPSVPFTLSPPSPLLLSEEEAADNVGARGREMQRDGLGAGGTGTMLLDSKILARLAGADERLFHRTLSLRRRPATTRMSTTTTPIWVRSLHSALSHPLSPSSWSLLSIRSSSFPLLSFAFSASLAIISADRWWYVPPKLFLPIRGIPSLSRCFLYIFSIVSPNSGTEIDFVLIRDSVVFQDEIVENLARDCARENDNSARLCPLSSFDSRERDKLMYLLNDERDIRINASYLSYLAIFKVNAGIGSWMKEFEFSNFRNDNIIFLLSNINRGCYVLNICIIKCLKSTLGKNLIQIFRIKYQSF